MVIAHKFQCVLSFMFVSLPLQDALNSFDMNCMLITIVSINDKFSKKISYITGKKKWFRYNLPEILLMNFILFFALTVTIYWQIYASWWGKIIILRDFFCVLCSLWFGTRTSVLYSCTVCVCVCELVHVTMLTVRMPQDKDFWKIIMLVLLWRIEFFSKY